MTRPEKIDFIHQRYTITDKSDGFGEDLEIIVGTNGEFFWCGLDGTEIAENHVDERGKFLMPKNSNFLHKKLMELGFHC